MSDEPPPSLRLKMRQKPAEAGSPEAQGQPSLPAEEAGGGFKIRLRPKLAPEPEPAAEEHPVAPPLPEINESFSLPEPVSPPAPALPAADVPKFRLKTKAVEQPPAQAAAEQSRLTDSSAGESDESNGSGIQFETPIEADLHLPEPPPSLPEVASSPAGDVRFQFPTSPALPPVPSVPVLALPPVVKPRRSLLPKVKAGTVSLIAAIIFILLCGAFFIHRVANQPSSTPTVRSRTRIKTVPVQATVEPTPMPAVAAPTPAAPVPTPVEAPKARTVSNLVTTPIAPGITVTSKDTTVEAIDASPSFRSWVASAKIGGVFQGANPRALINGRLIRAGMLADEGLDITFDRIDAPNKTIIFKDRTGAEVSRRY